MSSAIRYKFAQKSNLDLFNYPSTTTVYFMKNQKYYIFS